MPEDMLSVSLSMYAIVSYADFGPVRYAFRPDADPEIVPAYGQATKEFVQRSDRRYF